MIYGFDTVKFKGCKLWVKGWLKGLKLASLIMPL